MTSLIVGICLFLPAMPLLNENVDFSSFCTGPELELNSFTYRLSKHVPVLMKKYKIPGVSMAILKDGRTAWCKSFGFADIETGRKMTNDTYCRVESISKSVTAWGVMKLVENGIIELDQPVQIYLKNWKIPDSEYSEEKITVRTLLSHSSGFPLGTIGVRYSPVERMPSLEERLTEDAILKQEPGLSFLYSNTGYNILELLIEEVTGREFAEYMKNEVLIPLGMLNSDFIWSEEMRPEVPFGYDLKGNPIPVYVYPDKASGGLFASVEDIATFVAAGMKCNSDKNHKVISENSIDELYNPKVDIKGYLGFAFDYYGFGHFIEYFSNGIKAISHGGQGTGWMTHFHSVPSTGDGIVILTNSQRSWPLISYILTDWAEWNRFPGLGMSKIVYGNRILRIFIFMLLIVLSVQSFLLFKGILSGRRRFKLPSKSSTLISFAQFFVFVILSSVLIRAVTRQYLFVSSVFPVVSEWLGYSILFTAILSLMSALFPCFSKNDPVLPDHSG